MIAENAPILAADAMRAAERRAFHAGVSQDELMERAGTAVARATRRLSGGAPVLVLAGPGNNGGDAYVAARLLREAGQQIDVAAIGPAKEGAASRMAARWNGTVHALSEAPAHAVVLDGLLGSGPIRPFDRKVEAVVTGFVGKARLSIAIDLPSGLDADSGRVVTLGGQSDVTIALGALKPGLVAGPDHAALYGHVLLSDIGIDVASSWRTIARPSIAPPSPDAHKYTRGMVVVVGGTMPGAAALAATAALHAGAGYVVLASARPVVSVPHAIVQRRIDDARALERLLDDARIGCVVIGPGLGRGDEAGALLEVALRSDRRLVIDGDALSALATAGVAAAGRAAATVLTPHAGEFERLFGDASGGKIAETVRAAERSGATVIHKGPDTVIAASDGSAVVSSSATAYLSTAGTGDVLAGIVGARLAAGSIAAPAEAVWLHAEAARRAGVAFAADDLPHHLPAVLRQCLCR